MLKDSSTRKTTNSSLEEELYSIEKDSLSDHQTHNGSQIKLGTMCASLKSRLTITKDWHLLFNSTQLIGEDGSHRHCLILRELNFLESGRLSAKMSTISRKW
jgi:hypothetical protein